MAGIDPSDREKFQEDLERELQFFRNAIRGAGAFELSVTQVSAIEDFCSDWTNAERVLHWYNTLPGDSSRALAEIGQALHLMSKSIAERGEYNKRRFFPPKSRTFFDDMHDRFGREVWEGLYSFYSRVFGSNPAPTATEFEIGLLACSAYAAAEPLKAGNRQLSIQTVMLGVSAVGFSINTRLPKPTVVRATLDGRTIEIYVNPGPEISWNRINFSEDPYSHLLEDCILTELFNHLNLGEAPNPSACESYERLRGCAPSIHWSPLLDSLEIENN